jgi:transposase
VAYVITGVDPHKRSVTIEIIDDRKRPSNTADSAPTATATRRCSLPAAKHKDRIWAVEGCNGIGRHVAQRLVADGETVVMCQRNCPP